MSQEAKMLPFLTNKILIGDITLEGRPPSLDFVENHYQLVSVSRSQNVTGFLDLFLKSGKIFSQDLHIEL